MAQDRHAPRHPMTGLQKMKRNNKEEKRIKRIREEERGGGREQEQSVTSEVHNTSSLGNAHNETLKAKKQRNAPSKEGLAVPCRIWPRYAAVRLAVSEA